MLNFMETIINAIKCYIDKFASKIPTKISDLENDNNHVSEEYVNNKYFETVYDTIKWDGNGLLCLYGYQVDNDYGQFRLYSIDYAYLPNIDPLYNGGKYEILDEYSNTIRVKTFSEDTINQQHNLFIINDDIYIATSDNVVYEHEIWGTLEFPVAGIYFTKYGEPSSYDANLYVSSFTINWHKWENVEGESKLKPELLPNSVLDDNLVLKIPTKISDLTNDSGFLTEIPGEYVTETELNAKFAEGADQLILLSPNGTRFSITVGDDGVLTASEIV